MGDGSSKIPTYFGEGFAEWSKKMKIHLISQGLWSWVEEGLKDGETAKQIKQEIVNDAKALLVIRESLSPDIFMTVLCAKTAKEAWDTLHHTFMPQKKKNKEKSCINDGAASTDPPSHGSVGRSKTKQVSADESTDDDVEVKPLSGDKPFFDIVLRKSALFPFFILNFPKRFNSVLPSNNVKALVRFLGKVYEIKFYGARRRKSFGSGWMQLVQNNNLEEGDSLVFKIIKCDEYKVEMNMQVIKNTIPEQEIKRRKSAANKPKVVINLPDYSSASDEDEWY